MEYRFRITDADEKLRTRCEKAARLIYGGVLPTAVEERLTLELGAIERCGFSTHYLIAAEIADEARRMDRHVTSRGMISSSFVAWLCGMTAVNPLPVHHRCGCCRHLEPAGEGIEFHTHGFDLSEQPCPVCGCMMRPDGADLLPEILMGQWFDREPDIYLNVAPDIRKAVVEHLKARFSDAVLLRAGISNRGPDGSIRENVHPGGIYFVPKDTDISAVTGLRENGEEDDFGLPVTVRDYSGLYGVFTRCDVYSLPALGMLDDLEQVTGVMSDDIPMNDGAVLGVFYADGFDPFASPGEGSATVREAAELARPECFSDIVQIYGLLHGTGTWGPETKQLLREGKRPGELIAYRDDILRYLTGKGAAFDTAFRIMEQIRKGRGLTDAEQQMMAALDVPVWFIDSCRRIRYVFPKCHGVEYAILSWKLAWYKQKYCEIYDEIAAHWKR